MHGDAQSSKVENLRSLFLPLVFCLERERERASEDIDAGVGGGGFDHEEGQIWSGPGPA
jgi:hypothetical protein